MTNELNRTEPKGPEHPSLNNQGVKDIRERS
jgi:hypothetical protein